MANEGRELGKSIIPVGWVYLGEDCPCPDCGHALLYAPSLDEGGAPNDECMCAGCGMHAREAIDVRITVMDEEAALDETAPEPFAEDDLYYADPLDYASTLNCLLADLRSALDGESDESWFRGRIHEIVEHYSPAPTEGTESGIPF